MDLGFEQMLAQHNQAFKDAEVFSSWMPPDSEVGYVVSIIKWTPKKKVKDGVELWEWTLTGRIEVEPTADPLVETGKLKDREFTINTYRVVAPSFMKGDARLLSGNPHLNDLKEAIDTLEASLGAVIQVTVRTAYNEKFKRNFTNARIEKIIDTTAASAAGESPVDDDSYVGDTTPTETASIPVEAPPVVS